MNIIKKGIAKERQCRLCMRLLVGFILNKIILLAISRMDSIFKSSKPCAMFWIHWVRGGGADILYLSKNPQNLTQATINALEDRNRIVLIDSLQNLQDTCCLVTTTSHIAYAYAFYYQKPVIFFLPAFKGIEADSPQFAVLHIFGIFAHSLKELKEKVLFCMQDSTPSKKISNFLARSLL